MAPEPVLPAPDLECHLTELAVALGEQLSLAVKNRGDEGGGAMSGAGAENRCYTRFTLNVPATIWRESVTVAGQVVNISLGGALLRIDPMLHLHEAVTVSVHDSINPIGMLNDLPATVVRTSGTDCAVRFERMLLERGIGDVMSEQMFAR